MGFFDDLIKKVVSDEKTPEEKFGESIVKLVEMALCDSVLTDSEYNFLITSAKDAGCDIDAFEKYLEEQITSKNIKRKEDGGHLVIQETENLGEAQKLKTLIDMALADGEISDEERLMLLTEAKKAWVKYKRF